MPSKTEKRKGSVAVRHVKPDRSKQADRLSKKTHFIRDEVELLLHKMDASAPHKGYDRVKFREEVLYKCFGLTDDLIMDRIFKAFDKDSDGHLSDEEWVNGMSIFLRGTAEEKAKFCFTVYDLNDDHYISREEMYQFLKSCMVHQGSEEDPDEGIKDLVEIVLKKMDIDHDNRVSLPDFKGSVSNDHLLLEVFGSCLPKETRIHQFMCEEIVKDIPKDMLKKQYPQLYLKLKEENTE